MPFDTTKPSGATSYKQTAFGIISRKELLNLELEGTKKGLEFVYRVLQKNNKTEITSEFIHQLHVVAFKWIFPDWAGNFRTTQVTYSGKEAPLYSQVPELVTNLCSDLRTRLENISHPSQDGYIDSVVQL